ncbi:hypothetical protein GJ496_004468 [Pomphorhynchus laevis]|nr:hypothetical protein GJ496_004468 [Pomphorhynchus laevis]
MSSHSKNVNGTSTTQTMNSSIPKNILGRINALRNLQLQSIKIESELCNKVFHLEQEFAAKLKPLLSKREKIVNGTYDPSDKECKCEVNLPDDCLLSKEEVVNANTWMSGSGDSSEPTKGIPNFWLQVLKNADPITSIIQEYDEPVLKFLTDITIEYGDSTEEDELKSFKIVFHFSPNEYFKNERLTKWYELRVTASKDEPFFSEFPEMIGCAGCEIQWYPGKNVTEKTVRRQRVNKSNGKLNFIMKTIPRDSFFHFFSPPSAGPTSDAGEDTTELEDLLEEHYELGYFMREKLIPNAVLFYTGESIDVVSSDYDDDDEDDEYDDESDNEEIDSARVNNYSSINRNNDEKDSNYADSDDDDNSDGNEDLNAKSNIA